MQKYSLPAVGVTTFPLDLFSVPLYSRSHILTFQELIPFSQDRPNHRMPQNRHCWCLHSHGTLEVSRVRSSLCRRQNSWDKTLERVGKSSLKTDESLQEIRPGAQDNSLNFKCKAQFFVLVLPTGTNSRQKGGLAKEKESARSNGLLVDHHTWDWCLI